MWCAESDLHLSTVICAWGTLAGERAVSACLLPSTGPALLDITKDAAEAYLQQRAAVVFSVIGLLDAILGETLAIIGFDIFVIPASIWIVTNIVLLVILYRPERWRMT
jgi:hypothetical protein